MKPIVLIFPDSLMLVSFLMRHPTSNVEVNEESLTAILPPHIIDIATKQYDACLLSSLPDFLTLA